MLLLLLGVPALAHVGLEDPPPRYPTDGYSENKACPCGVGPNDQYCSDPNNRSDPNRSTDVTSYAAGETITIQAHEVIGHSGRWRVAFDSDGADLTDFNANILLDIPDPSGNDGNVGQGDLWEFVVTLPNTPCTNCTLQLIQVMNGNTVDPVPDPVGESSYYQCADLELTGPPPDTGTTETPTSGTTDTATPGTTTSTGDPATPPGTTTDDTANPDTADTGVNGDEQTCSCATSTSGVGWWVLGLMWFGRRRR